MWSNTKTPKKNKSKSKKGTGENRLKGVGFIMGRKRQITHMIDDDLLKRCIEEAKRVHEARATVINRALRMYLDFVEAQRKKP